MAVGDNGADLLRLGVSVSSYHHSISINVEQKQYAEIGMQC